MTSGVRATAPHALTPVSTGWLARALMLPIRLYQRWLSPAMGDHCRFAPTCSSYALEALRLHGGLRGTWLTLSRLARCHPWNAGGLDPVPLPSRSSTTIGT